MKLHNQVLATGTSPVKAYRQGQDFVDQSGLIVLAAFQRQSNLVIEFPIAAQTKIAVRFTGLLLARKNGHQSLSGISRHSPTRLGAEGNAVCCNRQGFRAQAIVPESSSFVSNAVIRHRNFHEWPISVLGHQPETRAQAPFGDPTVHEKRAAIQVGVQPSCRILSVQSQADYGSRVAKSQVMQNANPGLGGYSARALPIELQHSPDSPGSC